MDCRVAYFEPTNNVLEVRYGIFFFFGSYCSYTTKNLAVKVTALR